MRGGLRDAAVIFALLTGLSLSSLPVQSASPESLKSGSRLESAPAGLREASDTGPVADLDGLDGRAFSVGGLQVYFIDVGQGDAEYIVLPNGKNVLIDGGPSGARIGAFLSQMGITEIEHVVLTHPHSDHYQGLNYVFDKLQVNNFYDTGIDNLGARGDNTLRGKAAKEPGCTTHYPAPGESLSWSRGVSVDVLSSCPEPAEVSGDTTGGIVVNNCSIVIRMAAKGLSVLFTGDIQESTEKLLVNHYGDSLASNILKVPHHGSEESAIWEFLSLVRPKYAVIEVGKNSYGLPTAAALDRLEQVGAEIFRTDRDGSLLFRDTAPSLLVMNLPPI